MRNRPTTLGFLLLTLSPLLAAAQAQQPAEAAPAADKPAAVEESILVTGSRVRRKDLTTAAPVAVISREQLEESGKLSVGEYLQSLPEQGNAPNFQLNNGGATYGADGATRVNLRSLGVTRTLVLVNGRRMVPSGVGASSAVDLNTIPAAAVERVEVLKDGASAIYGSDAIGGVVNVITRRSYNGTEASAQYGTTSRGDAQTLDLQATTGRSGESSNFLFSVGWFDQRASWLRDRKWAAKALTWDYTNQVATPGGSFRTPQGTIGLPADQNGNPLPGCLANPLCAALVASDPNWTNDAFIRDPGTALGWRIMGDADTYNFAAENYLTIPSSRAQVYSAGDTRVGGARAYYEMSYVQQGTQQNAAPMPLNPGDYTIGGGTTPISVSADSMYNPFGVDLPFAGRRLVEFGHRTYTQELATFRVVTGLDGTLPRELGPLAGWFWDVFGNYGRTSGNFTTNGAIRNSRIADAVGPSMLVNGVPTCVRVPGDPASAIAGCVPINLLGGPNNGSITADQINGLGFEGTSRAYDALFSAGLNLSGELFTVAADRPASLALGYEFRRQSGAQIADPIAASGDSADFNFKSTRGHFTVNEVYGELLVPLLSNAPGARDLEATVAGRYVDYSTFGSNFSYKLGARWTPIPDLTVRGTWSTAFRAPTIGELYLGQSETAPTVTDPCNFSAGTPQALRDQCLATGVPAGGSGDQGNQQLTRVGGNAGLEAETARILTAGVVLQPTFARNLTVTVDYYRTAVDDVVGTLGTATILAGCYPGAAGVQNRAYCDLITRASTSGRILFVTDVNQNLGKLETAGVDFAVSYLYPTSIGRFRLRLDGTWLSHYDRTQPSGAGSLTVHGKGNYDLGALPEWKLNLGASWARGPWSLGAVGRYVGSFKECGTFDSSSGTYLSAGGLCYPSASNPSRQVGANVTVDLHGSWNVQGALGKTTVRLGVNNVLDKAPQYVYAAPLANSDPTAYDYLGRNFYLRASQAF